MDLGESTVAEGGEWKVTRWKKGQSRSKPSRNERRKTYLMTGTARAEACSREGCEGGSRRGWLDAKNTRHVHTCTPLRASLKTRH